MMSGTHQHRAHARAIPARGARRPRSRRWSRTPFVAVLLSLLALLAPPTTLAPLAAVEPSWGPRPIDLLDRPPATPRLVLQPIDERTPTAGAAPADDRPTTTEAYQAALDAARAEAGAYGVAFAVARDGAVLWAGSSGTDRDSRRAVAPTDPFVIGSVTKTFVAATVLQLVDEGRIGLEDPARRYLPDAGLDSAITIRRLLDHTSGLADLFNDTTRLGIEEHPDHAWTTDEVLGTLHAPWYEPGEGWAYANTNYLLLGLIVERVTGADLAAEIGRRFLEPLNLDTTRMLTPQDVDGPLEPAWTTIFWGSGAMVSSAADLARWGDALYGGRVLSRRLTASMLTTNDHDYGLGAQRIDLGGTVGYGHTGLLNTYTTLLVRLPEARVTVALLVNRTDVDLAGMLGAAPPGGAPSLLDLAAGLTAGRRADPGR